MPATMIWDWTFGDGDTFLFFYVSGPKSKGRTRCSDAEMKLMVTDTGDDTGNDYYSNYVELYGAPHSGQKIFWRVEVVWSDGSAYPGVPGGTFRGSTIWM